MKRLCIHVCEKATLTIEITDSMEQDLRECLDMAERGGEFKDCAGCSWYGMDVTKGTPLC